MSCQLRFSRCGHTKELAAPHRSRHAEHALLQHMILYSCEYHFDTDNEHCNYVILVTMLIFIYTPLYVFSMLMLCILAHTSELKTIRMSWGEAKKAAQDRDRWKLAVMALCSSKNEED